MAAVFKTFFVRDNGAPSPALVPVFLQFSTASAAPLPLLPRPTISNLGGGWYGFPFDAEVAGEAIAVIDAGAGLTTQDRYVAMHLTRDSGRIQAGIDANGFVVCRSLADGALDALVLEPGVNLMPALARMAASLCGVTQVGEDGLTWTFYAMGSSTVPRFIAQTSVVGERIAVEFF